MHEGHGRERRLEHRLERVWRDAPDDERQRVLTYELYKESGRTNVWGDSGGAAVTLAAASSNAPQTLTVYGRVPPGQDVGVASYTDTVLITVTF